MNRRYVLIGVAALAVLLVVGAGAVAKESLDDERPLEATGVPIGEPGLSFRYVETFGVTEQAYIADAQHLNSPNGLFIDNSDNLYVVEERGARMLKYRASDGANLMSIGTAGLQYVGDYVFSEPKDVAVDSSGNIWVVDRHRATQYDSSGNFLQIFPDWDNEPWTSGDDNDHFDTPRGIAFDSAGRMYVSDTENHRIQVYTFTVTGAVVYSTTIGETGVSGSDNSHFNRPAKIVTDSSARLYVADVNNFRVQRCTYAAGWTCATFHGTGSQGSGSNELSWAYGLGIDSSDNIYIADAANGRIKKCDSGGACSIFASGFDWPADVAVDSSGNVYVSDWNECTIHEYNSSGVFQSRFAGASDVPYLTDNGHFNRPYRVAVGGSNNIILIEGQGHRLLKLNSSGVAQWSVGEAGVAGSDDAHFQRPRGVATDASEQIYVADANNNRVQIFNSGGTYIVTLGSYSSGNYQFDWAADVALDQNGYIYVADTGNHRVQIYNSSRIYVATLGATGVSGSDNSHFNYPNGVAVDSSGNIYVADTDNNRVQVFNSSRVYQRTIGSGGGCDDAFDRFCEPHDVAVDTSGRIYVADAGNNRVQVFDSTGAYLTTIGGDWGSNTGQFRGPPGVEVDGQGNVYVADADNHRIQKFAPGVPGWEQVNINGFGTPADTGVLSLEVFDGRLYAGASNWADGGQVWRTTDGTTWAAASEIGFGSAYTATNTALIDMIEFDGQLYVSTGWGDGGGQIWRSSNGTNWTQVEGAGFGDPDNFAIATFAIFSDTLYVTTHGGSGLEIWRSSTGDSGDWSRVIDNGNGDAANQCSTSLMEFNGYLYAAVENETDGAEIWRTANGITWTAVITGGFGIADNIQTGGFAVFDGYLYIGTRNDATGAEVWRSNNGTNWTQAASDGFGDSNNFKIESLFAFDGYLYAGTDNDVTGVEIWRSSEGTTWTQVNVDGFGDSNNTLTLWSVGTVVFNNSLYVGVQNNADGGEVWMMLRQVFLPLVLSNY